MISSPCKNCPNVDANKDKCVQNCPLIQEFQKMAALEYINLCGGIDYTDDCRFRVSSPMRMHHPQP